ncbi:sensor histidine kinase [Pseudomonas caspiana]|uniref:Histidine kinase n=1 Tax=Pseudomonas caspiana TaxID=1451454 RepID=A0A1Y3PBE7_9PSED|nr:sensor histidine kinase [Pseudomonas caspiana]OUM74893.1 histidine kinase [Pseudomonas caspiana]
MHARTNVFRFRPLSTRNALWLNAVLCIGAAVGNVALYLTSDEFPVALLLLNLATFASVWQAQLRYGQSIRFQPQELADHMLQVQETERHRLSRELHDDIGQMLTAAKLQSEWLRRRLPSELLEHSRQLNETLDETLAKVRDVSAILHPRQLTSLGLEASLRGHLLRTLADSQVRWSLECKQQLAGIPEEMSVAAFRITQEAVTNVLRHAQAKNLLVRVRRSPLGLELHISDDGLGFTPAVDPALEGQRGMAGMTERAALLNGTWTINSEPGAGTRIDVLLPWTPRTHERANLNKKAR